MANNLEIFNRRAAAPTTSRPDKYPMFRESLPYVVDPQWHKHFSNMASGKLLRNTKIEGYILFFYKNRTKTKFETFNFNIAPEAIAHYFVIFMRDVMMLGENTAPDSPTITEVSIVDADNLKGMKPAVLRNKIAVFADAMCRYYKASIGSYDIIFEKILFSVEIGYIKRKNIQMVNGVITSIRGVSWDVATNSVTIIPDLSRSTRKVSATGNSVVYSHGQLLENINYSQENFLNVLDNIGKSQASPTSNFVHTNSNIIAPNRIDSNYPDQCQLRLDRRFSSSPTS